MLRVLMTWVLITGATSGIGKDAAFELARAGLRVIASGRSPEKLAALEHEANGEDVSLVTASIDVSDDGSVERAKTKIRELTGGHGIDVLVNNAGYGEMGPLETMEIARVRAMFETNVLGAARMIRAFVPEMRERRRGRVINVSSMLGRMTIATHGAYGATKFALEAMSDALRREMAPFGVYVSVIEPGSIATGFSDIAFGALEPSGDAEWDAVIERVRKFERFNARASASASDVSKVLLRAAVDRSPAPRYVVPLAAIAQLMAARLAPRSVYETAMRYAMVGAPKRAQANGEHTKTALVTGAAGGIGSATVLELKKRGFSVIATDVDERALADLGRWMREQRLPIDTRAMDVTDARSIERAARGTEIDVLVNNAGYAELGPVELVARDAWERQLEVNVYGLLAVTRAFAPAMRRARRGTIVNVSSVAGLIAFPFMGAYCASKFAIEAITDALRLELGTFGVRVTAVQPSFIRSGFAARAKQTIERYALDAGPYAAMAEHMDTILARLDAVGGEPADVARTIARAAIALDPHARYQAPFSASLAARAAPLLPSSIADRALSRMFEVERLG
jgi:short-subunit dehydrogenase